MFVANAEPDVDEPLRVEHVGFETSASVMVDERAKSTWLVCCPESVSFGTSVVEPFQVGESVVDGEEHLETVLM